jgi:hypothetical protein
MKYSEIVKTDTFHKRVEEFINTRWKQLYDLEKEWGDRAFKFLQFINAGGVVATLSFMGSSGAVRAMPGPKYALIWFLLGLLNVIILLEIERRYSQYLFKRWRTRVDFYRKNMIDYEILFDSEGTEILKSLFWSRFNTISEHILGYGSFICFLMGLYNGIQHILIS